MTSPSLLAKVSQNDGIYYLWMENKDLIALIIRDLQEKEAHLDC